MMSYQKAPELDEIAADIIRVLKMKHLDPKRIICMRSTGSSSKYILARIHAMQKVMAVALDIPTVYVIEVISENFDKLSDEEKQRTLLHELMHVPKALGGGLLSHRRFVTSKKVKQAFDEYLKSKHHPQVEMGLSPAEKHRRRAQLAAEAADPSESQP